MIHPSSSSASPTLLAIHLQWWSHCFHQHPMATHTTISTTALPRHLPAFQAAGLELLGCDLCYYDTFLTWAICAQIILEQFSQREEEVRTHTPACRLDDVARGPRVLRSHPWRVVSDPGHRGCAGTAREMSKLCHAQAKCSVDLPYCPLPSIFVFPPPQARSGSPYNPVGAGVSKVSSFGDSPW